MSVYARRIRAARAWADMTQEQLAERLGVDAQFVKRRENGSQEPKKGELIAMAAICGVPDWFLLDGFSQPTTDEVTSRLDELRKLVSRLREDIGPTPPPPGELGRRARGSETTPGDRPLRPIREEGQQQ